MPETLTAPAPPSSPERRTPLLPSAEIEKIHEALRTETMRILAALVLSLTLETRSLEFIAKAHPPKPTEQTNRERWEDYLRRYSHPEDNYQHYTFTSGGFDRARFQDRYNTTGRLFDEHDSPWTNASQTGHSSGNRSYSYANSYDFDSDGTNHNYTGNAGHESTFTPPKPETATPRAHLPFEIYPAGMRPDATEKAGATRANEVMHEQLEKQGWTGGQPTEEQVKKATRAALRDLHTDTADRSAVDQEAAKLISAQMSEVTKNLFGDHVNKSTPQAESESSEPETKGQSETSQPSQASGEPEPQEPEPKPPLAIESSPLEAADNNSAASEH